MKRHHFFTLCVPAMLLSMNAAVAQTPAPASNPAHSLTMEEAVKLAIQKSQTLQEAAKRVDVQTGSVRERRAAGSLRINNEISITQYNQGVDAEFNGQSVTLSKETQRRSDIGVSLPLDLSGQIRAAVNQATMDELASRFAYNATRNNLIAQVKTDYLQALRKQALVQVAEDALTNAKERLRVVQAEAKEGSSARFNVLRAETEVASSREAVLQSRNNLDLAYTQLRRTLGVEQSDPFTVASIEFDAPAEDGEQMILTEARETRPEILRAHINVRAAERGIKLARRESEPEVSLRVGYGYTPDAAGFGSQTSSWQATAMVRMPLFDGGISRARTQQARANVEVVRTKLRDTEEQIAMEVRQAYLTFQNAWERIATSETALTQATESYRLSLVRQSAGVGIQVEVTDAQAALTRAQTDLVHARYDLLNARNGLDRAMGRYAYGEAPGVSGPKAARIAREEKKATPKTISNSTQMASKNTQGENK